MLPQHWKTLCLSISCCRSNRWIYFVEHAGNYFSGSPGHTWRRATISLGGGRRCRRSLHGRTGLKCLKEVTLQVFSTRYHNTSGPCTAPRIYQESQMSPLLQLQQVQFSLCVTHLGKAAKPHRLPYPLRQQRHKPSMEVPYGRWRYRVPGGAEACPQGPGQQVGHLSILCTEQGGGFWISPGS